MKKRFYLVMLLTALAACESGSKLIVDTDDSGDSSESGGGGSTNEGGTQDASNDQLTLVGLVKMEPNSTEADFSRALFGRLDSGLSAEYIESYFAPAADTCEVVRPVAASSDAAPGFEIFDQQTTLVSAGENLIVSSNGGTYATLNRENNVSGPTYQTDVRLTGLAPGGLTVDIPGDQFPAFLNIEITDVPALQMTSPALDQDVAASTEFTWIPNNVFRSVIEVYASGPGALNNEIINIGCTVVDDGSFSFPVSVRNEMGADFIANWSSYLRVVYNVVQADDAIVFTANSVESSE